MENVKLFKDGERLAIVFEQVTKETEELILDIMSKYTKSKLGILKVEGVTEIPRENEKPLKMDKEHEVNPEKLPEKKNTKMPILRIPGGKYQGMTIEEGISKDGYQALIELKKFCNTIEDAQQKALFNAVLHKQLDAYIDEIIKKEVCNLEEEQLDSFFEILNMFVSVVQDVVMQAGCGNLSSFILCESKESKMDAAQSIIDKYEKEKEKRP